MTIVKFQNCIDKSYGSCVLHVVRCCFYISMKFHDNILNGFQVIEWTQNYHSLNSKGNNSKKI